MYHFRNSCVACRELNLFTYDQSALFNIQQIDSIWLKNRLRVENIVGKVEKAHLEPFLNLPQSFQKLSNVSKWICRLEKLKWNCDGDCLLYFPCFTGNIKKMNIWFFNTVKWTVSKYTLPNTCFLSVLNWRCPKLVEQKLRNVIKNLPCKLLHS